MKGAGFVRATLLLSIVCLAVAGCAGESSRPPTQAEQEQIRKDADVTFEKLKAEEQRAGKGPEQPY